jgi:hypothetical protein
MNTCQWRLRVDASHPVLRAFSALAFLVCASGVSACADTLSVSPRVHLKERAAYSLPDSFLPLGLALADSGPLVVWGRGARYLWLVEDGVQRALAVRADAGEIVGAAINGSSGFEVVTSGPAGTHIVRLSPSGQRLSQRRVQTTILGLEATRVGGRWFIAGNRTDGAAVVVVSDSAGVAVPIWSASPGVEARDTFAVSIFLSPSEDETSAWVASVRPPFQSWKIGPDGRVLRQRKAAESLIVRAAMDAAPAAKWSALRVVEFGGRSLQTLSDLRSGQRLLLLSKSNGDVQSVLTVNGPFGVAAATHEGRTLCAMRTTRHREIVCYSSR